MPSLDSPIQSAGALTPSAAGLIAGAPDIPKQPIGEALQQPLDAQPQPRGKVARLKRVCELTGLGRSSIYNRMDSRSPYYGATFPHPFSLSTTGNGAIGWSGAKKKFEPGSLPRRLAIRLESRYGSLLAGLILRLSLTADRPLPADFRNDRALIAVRVEYLNL